MVDLRIVKTKEALYKSLIHLLQMNSFDSITVSQLCKEARVNRSTFYMHYQNIDELFKEHFDANMALLKNKYVEMNKKLLSLDIDSMVPLFQHILAHRQLFNVLLSEHAPLTYTLQFQQALAQFPSDIIKRSLPEDIDLSLYYAFCVGATVGMIAHWKKTNYKLTPEQMGVYIVKFFHQKLPINI